MADPHVKLYPAHVQERQTKAEAALAATGFDALVIQSGVPFTYYSDDQDAPFKTTPHFAHWVPLEGPQHLLCIRAGKKPLLVRVKPEDYWYEQTPIGAPFWLPEFDFKEVPDEAAAWKEVGVQTNAAYLGDTPAAAQKQGIAAACCNPSALVARLDWDRARKSAYEIACMDEASKLGGRGHLAARGAFLEGKSELEIHQQYLLGVGCLEKELPYESIVALDAHGATLHYTGKRTQRNGRVLLIDCGAKFQGYASDITRTWAGRGIERAFAEIHKGLDLVQLELCKMVKPGLPYLAIHEAAHEKIADLLKHAGVIKLGGKEAVEAGLTHPFFPHGVGHFLGLQVHDIGGRQKAPEGGTIPPPPQYPYLRTTRTIEEGQVFTIEPGVYFIEMLLRPHREGPKKELFDWELIKFLFAHGGVRIEDNLLVTKEGHRNLTRPHI
ncbi:MAG: Xaa-Pro dipeptidase [Planctomycetes bacterium]|nr:Xaa-Pro dipeptidase [Planctomycetota bacterium]